MPRQSEDPCRAPRSGIKFHSWLISPDRPRSSFHGLLAASFLARLAKVTATPAAAPTPAAPYRWCRGVAGMDKGAVEPARIPEIRLRTAEATVAGLHRPGGAAVPFRGGTGVVGDRPLAAQFEQTPAVARAFIVEGFGELALIVERPPVAAVMDGLAEEGLGSALTSSSGSLPKVRIVGQHAGHDHRDRRATRHVDDGLVLDDVDHRDRAGRVRLGVRDAAECSAGADRDYRRRTLAASISMSQIGAPAMVE